MSFDPTQRELCPDGACIGVIGPDGRCKECGRVGSSQVQDARHRGMRPSANLDATGDDDAPEPFDDRELCPDGACVGVIGDDGRCRECGRAAEPAPASPALTEVSETPVSPEKGDADDWDDRELCPDDTCIGVLGADGTCPVCGAQASKTA